MALIHKMITVSKQNGPRVPYPGARGLLTRYESGDMNATSWFRTVAAGSRFSSPPKRQLQNKVLVVFVASLAWTPAASARQHAIDSGKSVMTVRVYKAGVFSAMGHEHEIAAPITDGVVDSAAHRVELHIKAGSLRVHDPNTSERDRDEIQKTMLGSDVLDVEDYTEIVFRSTAIEPAGSASWKVRGDLTLHGQTRPITVEIRESSGHYVGASRLKQTEFGMKPVKVAGGTIQVKDEVRVEFDIQLAR
jgi:polyisoprenoid-binding protein YceI